MKNVTVCLIFVILISGCTAGNVSMRAGSVDIEVGHGPPSEAYELIGPITAKHMVAVCMAHKGILKGL